MSVLIDKLFDLEARCIMWWRVNVSGRLHLGEFLRFVLEQKQGGAS